MLIDVPEWRHDILEEHIDGLGGLWGRRLRAAHSPSLEAVGLRRIDARLEAHGDALLLAGEHAWPFVQRALESDDPALVAAAGLVIASGQAGTGNHEEPERRLLELFAAGTPPVLEGLVAALELRATPTILAQLAHPKRLTQAPPLVAVSGWTIVAAHGGAAVPAHREQWLRDEATTVRRLAWRAEARLGERRAPVSYDKLTEQDYLLAFADPDREVRRTAIETAARTRQPWLLRRLRGTAGQPSLGAIDEYLALAALGGPADQEALLTISASEDIGWYRFLLLGLCGTVAAVNELLRWMHQSSAVEAALAAAAFFRVTGIDVQRAERVPLVPVGAEPDELSDEIRASDAKAAEDSWRTCESRMGGARWVRGVPVDALPWDNLPLTLDLEARWYLHLRAAFVAKQARVVFDTERYPFA